MRPATRLVMTALVLMSVLGLGFRASGPINRQAQAQGAAELPVRAFQDLLVAPHAALGKSVGAQVGAGGSADPKSVALTFVRDGQSGLIAATGMDWQVETSEELDKTLSVVRLAQSRAGIPVFGAGLTVQVEGDTVRALSGAYLPEIAADSKPAISVEDAFKAARTALALAPPHADEGDAAESDPYLKPTLDESELVYFSPALFDLAPEPAALAYRLVVTAADGSESATVIVDALSGKVRLSYTNYHNALNRIVRDANGATTTNAANCHLENGPVGTAGADCVAAFQNTGVTYDYFFNTHGRDSFNNAGAAMIAVVRFGTDPNAFWNGQLTAYGPGFATRDVVAHEWAHAVTQYTAGLIYQNQSGALNESFSDIFGAMVDRDDWEMGEDTPIGVIRDLSNPPAHNQPDRMSNYNCTTGDNGGVHINSGIPNKLAFLMSDGGTFNGQTVAAVGRNATERIFYRALVAGLNQRSTFSDLNSALLAAAAALYGQSSSEYAATAAAAQAVELAGPLPCGGSTAQPDPFEEDDSPAQAPVIPTDGTPHQPHNFHETDDLDWVRFSAVAGTPYLIETFGLQSAADTILSLYAADGTTLLASNDDISPGNLASRVAWTATANSTIYVRVSSYGGSGGPNTGYQLRVTGSTPQTGADAFEPDNSQAAARPITVGGAAQDHNFHVQNDLDWVSFSAVAGTPYIIETFDLGSSSDTVLDLYNSAGSALASNDDIPGSLASRITWTAPANGSYAVRVRHFSGAAGPTTSYRLRILGTAPAGDAFEPDNTQAAARPISTDGTIQRHTFNIPSDQDWVYFDVTPDNAYTIETLNLTAGNDTVLELYNSGGTLLAQNDDAGSLASRIGYTPASAQRLFVKARHYSSSAGSLSMAYDLRVIATPISAPDAQEPDNAPAQARAVTPGSPDAPATLRYNYHQAADQDWVRITTVAGNQYIFETSDLEARADTVLSLFSDGAASPLVEDDDSGEGLGSRIVWVAPDGADYFLRSRGYSSAVSGPGTGYTLRVSTAGTPGTPDAFEPDNTAPAAREIVAGAVGQEHNFHVAGDQDWVFFSATGGTQYTITTANLGTRADTVLELYDNSGTNLLAFNDDSDLLASRIFWTAPANGTYRLKVRQFASSVFGPNTQYTLNLAAQTDSYEPDNSQAAARPITVNGAAQAHNFHTAGDQDWLRFDAQASTVYTIETLDLGPCSDTVVELYNSGGTLLAQNDDYNGLASRVVWISQSVEPLFLKVRHYAGSVTGPCTSYNIRVVGQVSSVDSYEPDDSSAAASPIAVNGAAQAHTFHVAGDQDWVSFDVINGWTYTVATSGLGSCADTLVELFDRNNNLLVANDDYNGLASRVVWITRADETLYARVRDYNPSASGSCTSYNLAVSGAEVAPDAFEPDDSAATGAFLAVGGAAQRHSFHTPTDPDWVRFSAAAGTTYTLRTFDLGANSDTVLELHNSAGTQLLAFNDDFDGYASRIVWTAPASDVYALRVRPYGSTGGRVNTGYSLSIVTGSALAEAAPVAAEARVSFDDGGLPPAGASELRVVGAELIGTAQVGAEFTTVVRATGAADEYKLHARAKSAYVELVAIQPLGPAGAALDMAQYPAGPPWSAQVTSQSDLAVYAPWSSAAAGELVALRWRVVAQPESKQLELPISLIGRADGRSWQAGTVTMTVQVPGEIKVEEVSPTELTLGQPAFLSVRVSGLAGELPKIYLVDVESLAEQQIAEVGYAPGSSDTLIATLDASAKAGTYKVRVDVLSGASATSDETVRLLAPDQITPTNTPTSTPTNTPTNTPTTDPSLPTNTPTNTPTTDPSLPTNTPTSTTTPIGEEAIYLPLLSR